MRLSILVDWSLRVVLVNRIRSAENNGNMVKKLKRATHEI